MSPDLLLEIFKKTFPQYEVLKWKKLNVRGSVLAVTLPSGDYVFNYFSRDLWLFMPMKAFLTYRSVNK